MCSNFSVARVFFNNDFAFSVATQEYRVTVHEESVITGNSVLIKCNIPSFVADFLSVTGWINSEGVEFLVGHSLGNSSSL